MLRAPRTPAVLASLSVLALAALAAPAAADASLVREDGILGDAVTYRLDGDPGEIFVLVPSISTGPTPLALFDPADPRVLDVGLELLPLWAIGVLDGAGLGTAVYPLPLDAGLHGLPIHAQMVTAFGATTLVDEISNLTSFVLGLPQDSHEPVGTHAVAVDGQSVVPLPDGRVLLSGGVVQDALGNDLALDVYHVFDHQTQTFAQLAGTMGARRTQHTATVLADGRVLTLGGADEANTVHRSGELVDPATGAVTPIPDMSVPRVGHTATLLADGRVFVAGGTASFDFADPLGALGSVHRSTALYDPGSNTWSNGPNLPKPRALHSASRLGNGQVLLTGGIEITTILFIDTADFSNDARRYVPATNQIQSAGSFAGPRAAHGQLTLPSGDALVVGGVDGDLIFQTFTTQASVRRYNAASNSWSNVASLAVPRALPNVVEAGGTVVAIGGVETFDLTTGSGTPADEIETTTTAVGSWTTTGTMLRQRPLARSVLFDLGDRVLSTGTVDDGVDGSAADLTAEIYVP